MMVTHLPKDQSVLLRADLCLLVYDHFGNRHVWVLLFRLFNGLSQSLRRKNNRPGVLSRTRLMSLIKVTRMQNRFTWYMNTVALWGKLSPQIIPASLTGTQHNETTCRALKKTTLLQYQLVGTVRHETVLSIPSFLFLTLSWSISVSPVMTILFSMRVSEIPPFTVYNRDVTQAQI